VDLDQRRDAAQRRAVHGRVHGACALEHVAPALDRAAGEVRHEPAGVVERRSSG
jgi:hypothetical protein